MELVSVAALAADRVIGADGEIPWPSLPEDTEQYRDRVADDPVVLGRRTFESMRDALPGTQQVVMSRSRTEFDVPTAHHAASVEEAVEVLMSLDADVAYVLGGGEIYALFQPHLDRMVLSRVEGRYEGDAHYPEWDDTEWELASTTEYERFRVEEWVRRDGV